MKPMDDVEQRYDNLFDDWIAEENEKPEFIKRDEVEEKMPNEKGWYTKEEMLATGLPYIVNEKWSHKPYEYAVLLTRTRCKQLGMPALKNGAEKPSAFLYNNAPNNQYRYVPLYDRTDVFEAGELSMNKLYPHEIMGEEQTI